MLPQVSEADCRRSCCSTLMPVLQAKHAKSFLDGLNMSIQHAQDI